MPTLHVSRCLDLDPAAAIADVVAFLTDAHTGDHLITQRLADQPLGEDTPAGVVREVRVISPLSELPDRADASIGWEWPNLSILTSSPVVPLLPQLLVADKHSQLAPLP